MFFKKKQQEVKISYPEKDYLKADLPAFSFFKDGLIYDTSKAEDIQVYTYKDNVPNSLFGIDCLGMDLMGDALVQKQNSKVVLFKTVLDNWFCVYYVKEEAYRYSPMTKKSVARVFELNDDRENYEEFFEILTGA